MTAPGAHVGFGGEPDTSARDAVLLKRRHGVALEVLINVGDGADVDRILMSYLGDDVIGAPVDGQEAE